VTRLICGALLITVMACAQSNRDTAVESQEATTPATETTIATTTATETTATAAATPSTEDRAMSEYTDKVVELKTDAGDIHIRFFPDVAPNHVKNFIDLSKKGSYTGTKFHRIIPGFMIQGGDPNTISGDPSTWGMGGSGSNLRAEFNPIAHKRGIVSMARSNDPNSARSQFFIVVADSNFLDNQYTVFGQVTKGMDVADKIVNAPRGANDRPNKPIAIKSVNVREANADEKGPTPR
jgi:cyclophilin family peptidyl-prolyl cis-trans isomerase